jgi:hypothetical protein
MTIGRSTAIAKPSAAKKRAKKITGLLHESKTLRGKMKTAVDAETSALKKAEAKLKAAAKKTSKVAGRTPKPSGQKSKKSAKKGTAKNLILALLGVPKEKNLSPSEEAAQARLDIALIEALMAEEKKDDK